MASNAHPMRPVRAIFFYRKSFFLLIFGFTFWPHFNQVLDHLQYLFGSLLEALSNLLKLSWEASGTKNTKKLVFFKVFEYAAFWLFETPDGSLGLILPPLCPIWSLNGPQNDPQNCSKKKPKIDLFVFHMMFFKHSIHRLLMST